MEEATSFKDFKGTLYDFFGYFSPGALFLITIIVEKKHFEGKIQIYKSLAKSLNSITMIEIILFVFIAYIIGHIISSASSFIIEKGLLKRTKCIYEMLLIENILPQSIYEKFQEKFKQEFKTDYEESMFRTVLCYVQVKHISIYETAFVFLSFYGMARNFALIFASAFIWEIINLMASKVWILLLYILLYLVLTVVFGYEYYRFTRYYKAHIANGFLVP